MPVDVTVQRTLINAISAEFDPKDIMTMIKEDGGAEVDCHFCRNKE